MPAFTAFWNQLSANEKIVGYGIGLTILSWIVGLLGGLGFGGGGLIPAIIIGVIYWLKYNSRTPINWPIPVALLVLIIAGIEALLTLLALPGIMFWLGVSIIAGLALLINAVGAGVMAYGAWKEYQAMPKTTPPTTPPPPAAPPAPPAA